VGALLEITLPVFLVISFGWAARWRNWFSDDAIDTLMRFSQNFAIPLLLFRAISTLDLGQGYDPRLLASYYTGSLAGFLAGMLGARFLFGRDWQDSVAIGFAALFANTVLLGLPITERAFGPGALGPNYAIISIHAPFCYVLGITTMESIRNRGHGLGASLLRVVRSILSNPLVLAIIAGFVVNLASVALPQPLTHAFDLVIRAALPTALFALGGILYRYRPEGDWREVAWVIAISLMLHPLIAYTLSSRIFHLPQGMVNSATLTAAMAPGVNAYIFANMYGRARRVAATAVLAGTAASILSVTFWLTVLGA